MNLPKLPDRYEILCELGSGGMGAVYKIHDKSLDQIFALKILKSAGRADGSEIIRFQKEAKAVAALQHRNIMRIIDFGYYEKTTPYMVLEFLEGVTLRQYLKENGPLADEEALNVFNQIAAALSHAHEHKIIHRDLKSDNHKHRRKRKDSSQTPSIELFESIAKHKSLTDIKMHSMEKVTSTQVAALKALPNLRFITANRTEFEDFSVLSQLKNLDNLSLTGPSPEQVATFSTLAKLTTLSLEASPLSKKMATALCSLKGLTKMELRDMPVEPGAFSRLRSMKNLRNVTINGAPTITRADIRSLAELKLNRLELRRDHLLDEDLKQMADMSTLSHLDISKNEKFNDASLAYFYKTPKLKSLLIMECGFSEEAKRLLIQQRKSKGKFELIWFDKKHPY